MKVWGWKIKTVRNIRDTCVTQLEIKALGRYNNNFAMVFLTPLKMLLAKMFLIVPWGIEIIHEKELPENENSCILKWDLWKD